MYRVLHRVSATGGDFSEIVPPPGGGWTGHTGGGDTGGDKVQQGGDANFPEIWTIFSACEARENSFYHFFKNMEFFIQFLYVLRNGIGR